MITYERRPETCTEMAIWIDNNAYSSTCDDELLYEYLYHVASIIARKYAFFETAVDYDEFSLYAASRLFSRLKHKKQFETDENGNPKMKKIKSILNYVKKVLTHLKTDFEYTFRIESKDVDIVSTETFNLGSYIAEETSPFDRLEFSASLDNIAMIVKAHLKKIPVKYASAEWMNIYISCLLTLIDSITFPTYLLNDVHPESVHLREAKFNNIYQELRNQPPTLYHLPESMSNYICVLVNELRHVIASEISWSTQCFTPIDVAFSTMIYQSAEESK